MKHKKRNIFLIILASIIVLIGLFLLFYFCLPWNKDFFEIAKKEFAIPGLDTDFCPQGFTYVEGNDTFIIGGYMNDKSPSRYYVVDSESNETKYFTITIEGKDFAGHSGGITAYQDSIWIVSKDDDYGYCYRIDLADVLLVENGGKVAVTGKFVTNNGADFVFNNNGILWVGEFYKQGKYDTDISHVLKTRSGETNPAVVFGYNIDLASDNGVTSDIPVKALSIIGLCQGIDVTSDGKFILSTSYSLPDSNLYMYDSVLEQSNHSTIEVNGSNIPLWFLDNEALIKQVTIPSMSEEIVIKDNNLYILFESACKKYKLFNRVKMTNVYSLPIEYFA